MKKFSLAFVLDITFIFIMSTFCLFTILSFFIYSMFFSLAISILASFIITMLFSLLNKGRLNIKRLSKETTKKMQNLYLNFAFFSQNYLNKYFKEVFENLPISEKLKYQNKNICPIFFGEVITISQICKYLKGKDIKNYLIVSSEVTEVAKNFAKELGIEVLYGQPLYELIEKSKTAPSRSLQDFKPQKIKKIKLNLSNLKIKPLVTFGISLTIFSFFVPYPLYYLIFGTTLLTLSVILKFFIKKRAI